MKLTGGMGAGEKEEELEAALSDMSEVKDMYQTHIHELLEQLTPHK